TPDDPVVPVPQADLTVTKTNGQSTYTPGTDVVYTITVENNGPSPAANVLVVDNLPSGTTGSWTSTNGNSGTGDISDTNASIASGSTVTYTVTVSVPSSYTGNLENTVVVTSDTEDPTPACTTCTDSDGPAGSSDLQLVKAVSTTTPDVGDDVVFTLVVTNNGPSDATGVSVVDALPDGYSYVSNDGGAAEASGTVTWSVGNLSNGASSTLNITATVLASGSYSNSATVSGDQDDPGPEPNTDTPDDPVIVNPINNDPPVAVDDTFTIDEDTPATGDLIENDSDPDGDDITINTTPIAGPGNGTLVINPDGTFTYTPEEDFVGEDSFTYQICDNGTPSKCDEAVVTIQVKENRSISIEVDEVCLSNVPYVEYTVTAAGFTPEDKATITWKKLDGTIAEQLTDQPLTGMLLWPGAAVDSEGNPTDWPGWDLVDGVWVQIEDGLRPELTLEVSVNPTNSVQVFYPPATPTCSANPNNPPEPEDDSYETDSENPVTANLLDNDSDPDGDNLTITTTPVNGPGNGTLVINPDGTFTYTPDEDFVGTDSFTYQVCDDGVPSKCSEAIVTIVVKKPNTEPEAKEDSYQVQNCIYMTGNVLDNDLDADDDNLIVGAIPVVDPEHGDLVMNSDGSFTYTPDDGYVGEDSFSYQVCDDADNQKCAVGVVTIDVIAPLDTDGDSLLDCDEMGDPDDPIDTDDDGIPDFEDPDDDGDGIPTKDELDDPEDDCDDDGIPNYLDPAQFSCGELPVTNTVTPNNDGFNDFLKILGLDEFSENYIVVYNRWGNIVFEVKNYVSDPGSPKSFVGVANTTNSSNNVPDGTYFYVLKLVRNGKERVQKGSFEIRN
ncbi:MAG: Ig-like domain-containing protein, partial [Cyclobacteriaceae bacterium]